MEYSQVRNCDNEKTISTLTEIKTKMQQHNAIANKIHELITCIYC